MHRYLEQILYAFIWCGAYLKHVAANGCQVMLATAASLSGLHMTLSAVHAGESSLTGYMVCICPQTVQHLFTGIQHMLRNKLSWSSSYMAFLKSFNKPINPSINVHLVWLGPIRGQKTMTETQHTPSTLPSLVAVLQDMRIAWEEPFGPVIPVIRLKSIDDAIDHCNSNNLALQVRTGHLWYY